MPKNSKALQKESAKSAPAAKKQSGEKIRVNVSGRKVNEYYMAAAGRYRTAKWITFVVLIAFLLINLIFFRENITYSNMMYLLRDLEGGTQITSGEFSLVTYTEDNSVSFDLFKGRLAKASSSGFTLFNSTGSVDVDEAGHMQNPRLAVGEKYAVAYDAGGNSYSVYNTMARILEGTSEEIIEDCCVSDDGSFTMLTRSSESKYVATVYDNKLRAQTKYYRNSYVVDMTMDSSGDNLAMISAKVTSAGISGELMLCETANENTKTIEIENAMPLAAKYIKDGRLIVLCDTKVIAYDGENAAAEYSFTEGSPARFHFSDNGLGVVASENAVGTENSVYLFNGMGELVFNATVNEKVNDLAVDAIDTVYLHCDGKIVRLGADNSMSTYKTEEKVLDMVPLYGSLIVCEPLSASVAEFN